MTSPSRNVPPKASAMIEALRGLGYTTAGALADLIDNSISARATDGALLVSWDGTAGRTPVLGNCQGEDEG